MFTLIAALFIINTILSVAGAASTRHWANGASWRDAAISIGDSAIWSLVYLIAAEAGGWPMLAAAMFCASVYRQIVYVYIPQLSYK